MHCPRHLGAFLSNPTPSNLYTSLIVSLSFPSLFFVHLIPTLVILSYFLLPGRCPHSQTSNHLPFYSHPSHFDFTSSLPTPPPQHFLPIPDDLFRSFSSTVFTLSVYPSVTWIIKSLCLSLCLSLSLSIYLSIYLSHTHTHTHIPTRLHGHNFYFYFSLNLPFWF